MNDLTAQTQQLTTIIKVVMVAFAILSITGITAAVFLFRFMLTKRREMLDKQRKAEELASDLHTLVKRQLSKDQTDTTLTEALERAKYGPK